MTRHTPYAFGFFMVLLVVALSIAGIGPAQAQQDQPTQTPGAVNQNPQGQGGNAFAIQTGDTFASVLGRFNLTEEQIRQFLVANANLELDAGQTITFPAGVTVTAGGGAGGQAGGGAGQTTATPGAGQVTATPTAGGNTGNAGQTTATPGAGAAGGAGGQVGGQAGFNCAAGNANPGQTYVSQEDDTLGDVLTMMGLNVQAESGAGGNTGQGAQVTGTPTAGANQGAGQVTGTPTAGNAVGAGNQGQQGGQTGQISTNQVVEFVYLNCNLRFDNDQAQTVVVPAGIPQTGSGQQGAQQGQAGQQGGQQGQAQVYTVQQGETLIDIANRFGVTLEALVAANPNLLQSGQTLNIPAGQGQGAQQGGQTGQQGGQQSGQTGQGTQQGTIPQTGQQAQGGFGARLRHPYADPENLGHLAIYIVRGGDNLTRIARRFGTNISELQAMNPHIQDPNLIFTGQWILVHPGEQVVINPPNWQQTGANQNP